jgi:hypothetical protein
MYTLCIIIQRSTWYGSFTEDLSTMKLQHPDMNKNFMSSKNIKITCQSMVLHDYNPSM